MAQRIKNMTIGSPTKLLLAFALPLMLGNIFQQLYSVVDTAIVGQVIGVDALASLGATDWTYWLVIGVITGFTQGFSILISQYYGANDYKKMNRAIGASIAICIGFATVLLIGGQAAAYPVLQLMGTPSEVIGGSITYLRIMFLGIPMITAYNMFASILRALGDSKTPLYAMIVAAIINIGLDLLFVAVFSWGIAGAAIATIIAQLASAIFCYLNIRKVSIIKFEKEYFKPKLSLVLNLLKLGSPIALQNAIISIGGMFVQSVINSFGKLFLAGFTAANKLYGILELAASSYGFAVTSYVAQNLGAGYDKRIKKGVWSSTAIALGTSLIISSLMLIFGEFILGIFISGPAADVAISMDIAYRYLCIMSYFLPVLYMLYIYRSALMGLGNTIVPMASGFAELACRLIAVYTLPHFIGSDGVFFAEVSAWIAAAVMLIIGYFIKMLRVSRNLTLASITENDQDSLTLKNQDEIDAEPNVEKIYIDNTLEDMEKIEEENE